jgi:hypothetical protein
MKCFTKLVKNFSLSAFQNKYFVVLLLPDCLSILNNQGINYEQNIV